MDQRPAFRKRSPYVAVFIFLWLVCLSAAPQAEIYQFVDQNGVMHLTNVPTQPEYEKVPASLLDGSKRVKAGKIPPSRLLWASLSRIRSKSCYDKHIKKACSRYGVDYRLVKAVIKAESAFNAEAVSPKGAQGLMQLMPETSKDLGVSDPFDPMENISGGVRYLKMLMKRFDNNIVLTLAAYNAGPEAVQKYGGIPPYDETKTYVRKVLDFYAFEVR